MRAKMYRDGVPTATLVRSNPTNAPANGGEIDDGR